MTTQELKNRLNEIFHLGDEAGDYTRAYFDVRGALRDLYDKLPESETLDCDDSEDGDPEEQLMAIATEPIKCGDRLIFIGNEIPLSDGEIGMLVEILEPGTILVATEDAEPGDFLCYATEEEM